MESTISTSNAGVLAAHLLAQMAAPGYVVLPEHRQGYGPLVTRALRDSYAALRARRARRADAVARLLWAKLAADLGVGRKLREDGFFTDQPGSRAAARELFEAIMLASEREYEEGKLPLYATLLGNLLFAPDVSRADASRLLRAANNLTYPQLCVLAACVNAAPPAAYPAALEDMGVLERHGMLAAGPGGYAPTAAGRLLCTLMGLSASAAAP